MRKLTPVDAFKLLRVGGKGDSYATRTYCCIDWKIASAYPLCTNFINRGTFSAGDMYQHIKYHLYCVEIPLEGNLLMTQRNERVIVPVGHAYLIHQNEDSRLETAVAGFCRKVSIGFAGAVIPQIMSQTGLAACTDIEIHNFETLYTLIGRIEKLIRGGNDLDHPEICALSLQFIMELATQIIPARPEKLTQALSLMNSSLGDSLTIGMLARDLHIGMATLDRLFRTHLKTSPKEYYLKLKLENAKQLLLNTVLSVKEIAELCGYRDQFNFSAMFRRFTGVSPREFRNQTKK